MAVLVVAAIGGFKGNSSRKLMSRRPPGATHQCHCQRRTCSPTQLIVCKPLLKYLGLYYAAAWPTHRSCLLTRLLFLLKREGVFLPSSLSCNIASPNSIPLQHQCHRVVTSLTITYTFSSQTARML